MNFLNSSSVSHRSTLDAQWQTYKQLELISNSVYHTDPTIFRFSFGLKWIWRKFIELLVTELVAEHRVTEYLDRCWAVETDSQQSSPFKTLHRLWRLMD